MLKLHLTEYSLLSFGVSCGAAMLFLRLLIARAFVGWVPINLRQSSELDVGPTPRLGGVAPLLGILIVALIGWIRGAHLAAPSSTAGLLVGIAGMFLVGLMEDFRPQIGRFRFLLQALVATAAFFSGLRMESFHVLGFDVIASNPYLSHLQTVIWLILCTNIIGLVNGIDGLAGGIGLMVLGLTYDVASGSGDAGVALFIAGMAGGLVAFLWFNFPPARVSLGRNGTYFLGMALGGLSIEVSHKGALQFAFLAPTLAMGLPFLDMAVVLVRRLVRGVPLFRADRRHIHHRLQDQGLDSIQTLMVLYAVSVCFLAGGFVVMWTRGQLIPLVLTLLVILVLLFLNQVGRTSGGEALRTIWRSSTSNRREIQNAEILGRWLEVQSHRVASFDSFWKSVCFVVDDVGLLGIEIQGDQATSGYYSKGLPSGDGLSSRHRILGPNGTHLHILISADSANLSPHLFYPIAEILTQHLQEALANSFNPEA